MASQGGASSSTVGLGDLVIFVKDLRAPNSRKRKLTVKSWYSVKDVKDVLAGLLQVSVTSQRLFFRGREMRNARALHDCGVDAPGQTLFFAIHREVAQRPWSLEPYDSLEPPRALARVINQIKRGLELGLAPALSLEGTGGTYFMTDTRKRKLAAFKPQDEEPFAPNNPRGFVGMGVSMRPGIEPGEACIREVAAYLCDRGHFLGVPATTLVEARHPAFCYNQGGEKVKLGSLQEFVHHTEVVADISPSKLGARQVHKIAILDIRLLNGDRNDANILVRRSAPAHHHDHHHRDSNGSGSGGHARGSSAGQAGELELVPIDHGYCLPDVVEIGWCDWCWLDWPQLKKPLDKETLQYVLSLDPQGDAERLGRKLSLRAPCLRNFRVAGTLLKAGVAAGLTLHDVATIVVRHDLDERSELERIMRRARELARAAVDNVAPPPAAAAVSAAAGTPAGSGGGGGSGHRRAGGRDHPTDHAHRQPGHSSHRHRHHHNGHRHHSRSGEGKGEDNRRHRDSSGGRGDGDGGSAYDEDNEDSERAGGGRGRRACSSDGGGGDRVGLPIEDDTSPEPPVIVGGGALQRMRSNSELPPRSLNGGGLMNGGGGSGAVAGGSGGGGRAASSRSASGGNATVSSLSGWSDDLLQHQQQQRRPQNRHHGSGSEAADTSGEDVSANGGRGTGCSGSAGGAASNGDGSSRPPQLDRCESDCGSGSESSGSSSSGSSSEGSSSDDEGGGGRGGGSDGGGGAADSSDACGSPLGFWQERMEDIDARNLGRPLTPWSEPGGDDEGTSSPMQPLPRPAPGALPLVGSSGSSSDGGGSGSTGFVPGKTRSGRLLSVPEVDPLPPPALVAARGSNRGASSAAPPPPAVGDSRGGGGGAGSAAAATHALSFGAKIVRSYSYHGLRSEALYDSPDRRRSSRVGGSQLRRVAEDSDEFGEHFFRFVGMLIQETIKKVKRQKEVDAERVGAASARSTERA